jgi:hypothetical protein
MAVISTGNHPKALWPGIKAWFGRTYDQHVPEFPDLFDKDSSDKAYEESVNVSGFGLAPVKPEGGSVSYDSESQGYVSRLTHVAYALGYIVTYEELRDNLYVEVSKRRSEALAFSLRTTRETVAANVYNRAFTAGYTGGDGSVLCVSTHSTQAGNQSNVLTTASDLNETALEDMLTQIMGAQNDRGLNIKLMPQCLIVPRQEWFNANRILKSTLQNDSANNAVNVLRATQALPKGIKVNHYLDDADAWFVRTNCPRGMIHYEREIGQFEQDNDFDTKNAKAMKYERYSFGWDDFRGVWGTPGA